MLTPQRLLNLYRRGVFPMAHDADDDSLFIVDPEERGVLPLRPFRLPTRLQRTLRKDPYRVTVDHAFGAIMRLCAAPAPDRPSTWISHTIIDLYEALFAMGHAHSVECWRGDELVGGLYGVAIEGAFFGESMVSRATDASKIALAHLAGRLQVGGFQLLDAQFHTGHLGQFGCIEIPRGQFRRLLAEALRTPANFAAMPQNLTGAQLLQSMAHTS